MTLLAGTLPASGTAPRVKSAQAPTRTRVFARNVLAGGLRIAITGLVAVALPAYLTHRLPVSTFGAWVLVLQLGAYVSYLDLGVQTGIAKFIAENAERNDTQGCSQAATAGFRLLAAMGALGLLLVPVLALSLPHLFKNIPLALLRDTQLGVLLVGGSLSINLCCSAFAAIFYGLQRYEVPGFIAVANKLLYAAAIVLTVSLKGSMVAMGVAVAAVNLGAAALQLAAWRRWAPGISVNATLRGTGMMKRMSAYCSVLAITSAGMLCVGGLDLTLVARYSFAETGYYAVAAAPPTLLVLLLSAALGPLLPAASALSVASSARNLGALLLRVTRYCALLLAILGLPLLVWGGPLLTLWLGPAYAAHSLPLLRILIVANMIRNLLGPYATFVVATGRQRIATFSAVAEAVSNLAASILLAQRLGAIGVAYGTLIGAVIGVVVHVAVSMRYTYADIELRRAFFLRHGVLQPSLIAVPSAVILIAGSGSLSIASTSLCIGSTILAGWFLSLRPGERQRTLQTCARALLPRGRASC